MQLNSGAPYGRLVRGFFTRSASWPAWLMAVFLGSYVIGLLMPDDGFHLFVDGWLASLLKLSLVVVCWAAVMRKRSRSRVRIAANGLTRFRHPELLLTAAAVTIIAIVDSYSLWMLIWGAEMFPRVSEVGYLLFFALMLAVLVIMVRRQLRGMVWSVVLDSAIGALGAASVLAVLLGPMANSLDAAGANKAIAAAVAYPLFDLLLVAVVVALTTSQGPIAGRRWILLVFGLLIFTSTGLVFAMLETRYVLGTPLDAGWAVGLALIAVWADASSRPDLVQNNSSNGVAALALPAVSTAAGLGVLLLASQTPVPHIAVGLAAATLALAAVPLVSRQVALRRQSKTDELTGLPNRRALYAEVSSRLADDRSRNRALLLLDLDRFKEVNDSLGHDAGDRLLVQVGRRLLEGMRSGDLLARLGGDEFAILLEHTDQVEAEAVANKLRATLAQPFTLEGISLQTSASIGIALYPNQGDDLTALLRKADMAMYKAKATHSGHHVYRSADNRHGDARLRTLQELRLALTEDQLVLHYQPKICLKTGFVSGVEALVRWNHPERGLLFPDQFLTLVEEAGLMHALTQEVLRKALDQSVLWSAQARTLTVAVNVSASSLIDADLPERVGTMLSARGLLPTALMLEITEDFLMADRDRARDILTRLRASGIRISVDDFGTGYSSLAYLRDLPIDELKLDQSFIFPMADDARAAALVASTIDLAHGLGLKMVAEGVENSVAYDELVRYGCDFAQGYFMSRPISAAALDEWLTARQSAAALP
ncbi:EAL domain-containing protein [Cryobacterium sp. TMT2-18-3]|uniref:putative bifunctional diguanylate cyclase/phosphodiesterase n=1 Tax=unclassified Cryobacterium TaxID=2649013 RepID=UPI001069B28B|nr:MULTISPECIES: EAL domain-containing protein [unclassified Cryobacterium]TFC26794.1 EAL domain-containing protein [Cryobacterium sp. TMT2-18-2]TFC68790.1 EAL domain-containing protein [Cryobacterium sp. TMT2-18-3]